MILLTHENLHKGQTNNGGFNYKQLAALGVQTPPKKGWLRHLIGTEISEEKYATFLSLKGVTHCVKKSQQSGLMSRESVIASEGQDFNALLRETFPPDLHSVSMRIPIELVETVQGLIRLRESLLRQH